MQLQRYQDQDNNFRTALIASEGRKWMQVLVVNGGRLQMVRRPMTDKAYMNPMPTNERKARASLRRLARKRGTARNIRAAVAAI